jgi:hypothetical protein
MLAALSAAPRHLAAQDAPGLLSVVYGDGSQLAVRDWHFAYEYLESDTPLDPAYVATCTQPSYDRNPCFTQVKISKDLIVLGPLPGPSGAAKVPFILPEGGLHAIRIHWKGGPGDGRFQSDSLTIVTAQGAEIHLAGRLQSLEGFLSKKQYVYLMKISIAGGIQVQSTPGRFELRLDERFPPAALKERVDEIRFPSGTDRAGLP